MLDSLTQVWNVILVVVGFGLVIAIHELGHFLAARWAGIRVHAFAIGFGRAVCSFRRGMGFRRGSTEPDYFRALKAGQAWAVRASPTEYRLNWFPFGGYVKMLGQDDADPTAVSDAPDSFTSQSVPKRLVVISAGVVFNLITAALLFMLVYRVGISEPAPIVGDVAPGSPARQAGLLPGDIVRSVDGTRVNSFTDLSVTSAMAAPGAALRIAAERRGPDGALRPVEITATPRPRESRDEMRGILQLGVAPAQSAAMEKLPATAGARIEYRAVQARAGLADVEAASTLTAVDGVSVAAHGAPPLLLPLIEALEQSGGRAVNATFRGPERGERTVALAPEARLQTAWAQVDGEPRPFEHLLGFAPVLSVHSVSVRAAELGNSGKLQPGDVFVRLGSLDWPSVPAGIGQIRGARGGQIEAAVLRSGAAVSLTLKVSRDGQVGFVPTGWTGSAVVTPLRAALAPPPDEPGAPAPRAEDLAAGRLFPAVLPGLRIVGVGDAPVTDFASLRGALRGAARAGEAAEIALKTATVRIGPDGRPADGPAETVTLRLSAADTTALHALGWGAPADLRALFPLAEVTLVAANPIDAVRMGLEKTRNIILTTYLTFVRLYQGTVQVTHMKGPVGITDVGSRFAGQGFIYLLFFLALISVNLAVVNFLPIPITDGGHALLLLYEGVRGKPAPAVVQNALTLIGLVLIASVFLLVTFNDIVNLFR
ncbi:MAG: site-2 protease family protein [Phycisphaerales bacterium]|nr:site-2 protease family protein [Phycisphaerales bacterium]